MEGPDFLSQDLLPLVADAAGDRELFHALIQHPPNLIAFFETACEDPLWVSKHPQLIRLILRWCSKQFYLLRFPIYYAKQMGDLIRSHYSFLSPFLFFQPSLFNTMHLEVEEKTFLVNTFLFGTASPFFKELFTNCLLTFQDRWSLPVTLPTYHLIEEYILKGHVQELWKLEEKDLMDLMKQSKIWRLSGLVQECSLILKRYITKENVIKNLLEAHKKNFLEWQQVCSEYFNMQKFGLQLHSPQDQNELKVEVLDFRGDTLDLFLQLAPFITHLAFSGALSSDPYYGKMIERCPRLVGMDLSGSAEYDNQFDDLPGSLLELNLAACPWLRPRHLKEAGYQFLNLKKLILDGNVQLDYQAWGEIHRFHTLFTASFALCHQMTDDDLKLLGKSCSHLLELNIEDCSKVTNRGVLEIISKCTHLMKLNCSFCGNLTDKALVELSVYGHQLNKLILRGCTGFTDAGLFKLMAFRPNLSYLDVKGCNFTLQAIEKIRRDYPLLLLED
ncbi:MAG: hypothetical protein H0V82_09850 [Candidatus Protochlamydia sp.]|nr:hypothetical protein [Candidatus Protochlamydia sp.]